MKRSTLSWAVGLSGALIMSALAPRSVPATDDDFRPILEADLPEGFPGPGPVGEVVVKRYPSYRLARTTMTERRGDGSFWTLFRHIKKQGIAMTAPVEMTAERGEDGLLSMRSMAFLYGSTDQGSEGPDGEVDVVDVEAMTVASIGIRGARDARQLADALDRIERWLADDASWRRAGPPRVLSYNSPMVPASRRFHELQVPITRAEPEQAPPARDPREAW